MQQFYIYSLTVAGADWAYVGATSNITQRLRSHHTQLRAQTHANLALMAEMLLYPPGTKLTLTVLEVCDHDKQPERELYWIEEMRKSRRILNTIMPQLIRMGYRMSPTTLDKRLKTRPPRRIFNLTTKESFISIKEAARAYKCSQGLIRNAADGKIVNAKGCQWGYAADLALRVVQPIWTPERRARMGAKMRTLKMKRVINLDTQQVFASIGDAAKSVKKAITTMSNALTKNQHCGGYAWALYGGEKAAATSRPKREYKRVVLNLTTNVSYPSLKAAADANNCTPRTMTLAIRQQRLRNGCIFTYQNMKEMFANKTAEPVYNLSTGEVFASSDLAAMAYGVNMTTLRRAARGIIPTVKKCYWSFDEKDTVEKKKKRYAAALKKEQRRKQNQRAGNRVRNRTTRRIYKTIAEASRAAGVTRSALYAAIDRGYRSAGCLWEWHA